MSSVEVWLEFSQVRHTIKNNTVDKLKQILSGFNEECGTHLARSGKKQDLIDRIVDVLDQWRVNNDEERWTKAKTIIYQVRSATYLTPSSRVFLQNISQSYATSEPKPNVYNTNIASSSNLGHYDPYAPPRRPPASGPVTAFSPSKLPIRFKDSPFFSVEQAVSSVVECPESTSATDRRVASLTFTLNTDQLNKMKAPGSMFQLRLFCTSSIFYSGYAAFRANPMPCLIEFPPTCEVRINTTAVQANLKGLKKKAGTAPPPDISPLTRLSGSNKVEMVYVNSQQPVQSKKYYIVVMLVEATTTEALITKLKAQHYHTAEQIQQKMRQSMNEDDDIVAGPQKMSLKCPLTFVRISTPCRSEKCVHPQCFDAVSWFTMMEQTTTWLCPVCERNLDHKDLIIDGYFDSILKQTPDTIEDVVVEADGEWHTSDDKYASVQWKATHPPKASSPAAEHPQTPMQTQDHFLVNGMNQMNGKGKAFDPEVLVLDSDEDEDEGRVKRELSPSYASSSRASFDTIPQTPSQSQNSRQVIDLTLDSDDEQPPPPPDNRGKRKASEANMSESLPDQLWKKGRIDTSRILPAPRPSGAMSVPNIRSISNHPTSPSSLRFATSFQGNTILPPVFIYNRDGTSNPASLQLPPISNSFVTRPPSSSHNAAWPS